ncbi:MAG: alcohol dehydrogenase catalytic domain-containing protein [Armatimonadota bacterium]|nr:alcohol dehydrogenase catalytic domain-containing protein [Armatimonadota bacterium]MDR7443089.1 alcohol dehydrogenase catalytic domain-containing protein [Armatimonadota bacterium]MDR7571182.1 alcohol dehydrogenase catalytic domain-containing protein [Armatimonadota bacterium]MDR7614457.1 alcohol dehydrogenase catalytic domain-containing protein [Armatimonadota bacterium]
MSELVRAAVLTGPGVLEIHRFPRPKIGPDEGLLRIERCGICGSDIEMIRGEHPRPPCIPGHEILGVIEEVGERAAQRWGVQVGDRVAVEIIVPCRFCELCLTGRYMFCRNRPGGYGGNTPITRDPPLWGGYAEYLYLHPNAILHKVDKTLPADVAVMFNPLGAGVRWVLHLGGVTAGDTVLILGPGQRGLMAVIAAKMGGAGTVIVTGLARDAHKLELAKELGADYVINVEEEDTVQRVREITDGVGADVVLDVTPMAHQPVLDAIECVRHGGRVVLAGLKGRRPIPLVTDAIIGKGATVVGAYSVDARAYIEAIKIIESRRFPLEKLHTHTFGLEEARYAIDVLAGDVPGEQAVHVSIDPSR